MAKVNKNLVARVLKEVAEKYNLKGINMQNGYFALAGNFDLEATFLAYKSKEGNYSFLFVDVSNSSLFRIKRVYDCLSQVENILNGKVKVYHYPYFAVSSVKKWFMHNADGISEDEISRMEPSEVLSHFLEWEGIIGYTTTIDQLMNAPFEYEQE